MQDSRIGRRLMGDVLDRAAGRKFAGVRLVQAAYHSRSLALYAKLGFDVRETLFSRADTRSRDTDRRAGRCRRLQPPMPSRPRIRSRRRGRRCDQARHAARG
jgi:hypothetical protein